MRPGFCRLAVGNNQKSNVLLKEQPAYCPEWVEHQQESVDSSSPTSNDGQSSSSAVGDCTHTATCTATVIATSPADDDNESEDDDSLFSLLDFPAEVLAHILSFVDHVTLYTKCSVVCSRLYHLLKTRSFWSAELDRKFSPSELNWVESLSPDGSIFIDYGRLIVCQPFQRNLIKNCCGELKSAKHWNVSRTGDYQLAVEINKSSAVAPGIGVRMTMAEMAAVPRPYWLDLPANNCCFATSFAVIDMEQIVDFCLLGCQPEILDILRPPIAVGEWTASFDSDLMYRLEVFLLGANDEELASHFSESRLEVGRGGQWRPVSHVFSTYPAGVRRLLFRHSAIDPLYNGDQYGAKFAGSTVKLLFPWPANSLN